MSTQVDIWSKRRRLRPAAVSAMAALLVGTALAVPSAAAPAAGAAVRTAGAPLTERELRQEAEKTLTDAGYISVAVRVRHGNRRTHAAAGEARLGGGRPVPAGASFRAASVTKSFVAAVVLQLVAEGGLSLDDTVEKWLPGLVTGPGQGDDGGRITVRHLLQHTSGIYNWDYDEVRGGTAEDFERTRFDRVTAEESVAHATRRPREFPPADPDDPAPRWDYSNPGYIVAGMIVEKVTGRSWEREVERRVIRPLGLTGTYAPGDDPFLRGAYARTYHMFPGSSRWTDTTHRNTTSADAAGALVSTERDLDRFYTALLTGRLLPAAQLAEMRRTVPVGGELGAALPGLRYGLGLMRQPLSCGGDRWSHGGDLDGATVRTGVTEDGRRTVVIHASGKTADRQQLFRAEQAVQRLLDRALCGSGGEPAARGGGAPRP